MKVLFAVNDENISTSIVKKYQKQFKEIISYKNVYYFNAILKELQRNKSYDRIVISEDLEEFTSSSYEQKDKFIFDRLDNISDEALNIPIILICSERRTKSEDILVKLFGIGIYNAIIGDDRSTDEVCRLINKPRSKKEAKTYYNIESEKITYEPERENDVSEIEMQNILMHFKKIGKNEEKYVDSFNNIVSQYNDAQLKIIIAILPANVKEVLEEKSPEYQRLSVGKNQVASRKTKEKKTKKDKAEVTAQKGTSEKLLSVDSNKTKLSKPVVVPSTIDKSLYKKVSAKKNIDIDTENLEEQELDLTMLEKVEEKEKPKRRGRPRKNPEQVEEIEETTQEKPKRRGRPRKNPIPEQKLPLDTLPGLEKSTNVLPGFEDDYEEDNEEDEFDLNQISKNSPQEETMLPGFDDDDYDDNDYEAEEEDYEEEQNKPVYDSLGSNDDYEYIEQKAIKQYDNVFDDEEYQSLLTGDKKVVAFVGTSKNGTSFIVNNVAHILSSIGIDTAIFDATQNKNAYYIFTKNDENLRKTAVNSLNNLIEGVAKGIKINNKLTVYTNIPNQNEEMKNSFPVMETLVKNHSLVLIDCDFHTPIEYLEKAQEIYLIQSMDVLTIQPLTAFLRDLKAKNALDENKIRIILNKTLKVRGVTGKNIVGGMSHYNDPEMSFMTELFDRNKANVVAQIPFDEDVYIKYLESLIECEIKINGYPKEFKQRLNKLAEAIYPLLPNNGNRRNKKNRVEPRQQNNGYTSSFSSSMNDTLNNMKKRY